MASVDTKNKEVENPTAERHENDENVDASSDDGNKLEGFKDQKTFLYTAIGFAVGLGNFWRFPKVVQENGGGTFFIPYGILFFLAGVPLLYTELAIGQKFRLGNVECWKKISPKLIGVGACSMMISFFVGVYYNAILSWVIWYLLKTVISVFQGQPLPWSVCPNISDPTLAAECASTSPEQYFWHRETLNQTTAIDDFGNIQVNLLGCLVISWVLVFAAMYKGVSSLEKVVKFTTLLPYCVLMLFGAHTMTLEGAGYGVQYLSTPKWNEMFTVKVWVAAATQIFFSLSLGFGGMISFSGKNVANRNVEAQTWFISIANSFTSLFACIIVFGIRGFTSRQKYNNCVTENLQLLSSWYPNNATNLAIEDYPTFMNQTYGSVDYGVNTTSLANCSTIEGNLSEVIGGTGLAFVVFAETIAKMCYSPCFAFLFFFMLLSLGLASMFGNVEGVMTPVKDFWNMKYPNKPFPQGTVLASLVVVSCALSLLCLTGCGVYWVDFFDTFGTSFPLLIIAIIELIAVGWVYDGKYARFEQEMLEILPPRNRFNRLMSFYMRYTIKWLTPALLVSVFGYFTVEKMSGGLKYLPYIPNQTSETVDYPASMIGAGICLTIFIVMAFPIGIIYNHLRIRSQSTDKEPEAIEMNDLSQKDKEEK